MGWWSCTVMGGDEPMDAEGVLYHAIGLGFDELYEESDLTPADIKDKVLDGLSKMIEAATSEDNHHMYARAHIMHQVLGVIVMRHGLPTDNADVETALQLAIDGATNDQWAEEGDEERIGYINAYIEQLEHYDGTAQEPAFEGLLQKLAEHLAAGKEGLMNK